MIQRRKWIFTVAENRIETAVLQKKSHFDEINTYLSSEHIQINTNHLSYLLANVQIEVQLVMFFLYNFSFTD